MLDKKELHSKLITICDEILKEIIEPTCQLQDVHTDYWWSDIADYTRDTENLNQIIYSMIQEKYDLGDDEMVNIDSFTPIMQIALLILLEEYRPKCSPIYG
jgi:hypothetical protein